LSGDVSRRDTDRRRLLIGAEILLALVSLGLAVNASRPPGGVEMISYMTGPLLGNARAGWMASLRSLRFSIVAGGVICCAGVLLCIPLLPAFWRYRPSESAAL
jgi:hypothetical protein